MMSGDAPQWRAEVSTTEAQRTLREKDISYFSVPSVFSVVKIDN